MVIMKPEKPGWGVTRRVQECPEGRYPVRLMLVSIGLWRVTALIIAASTQRLPIGALHKKAEQGNLDYRTSSEGKVRCYLDIMVTQRLESVLERHISQILHPSYFDDSMA